MFMQRLAWAGVLFRHANTTILIDPIGQLDELTGTLVGEPLEELRPLTEFAKPDAVFVTHVHGDHFDVASLLNAYGSDLPLYLPAESVATATQAGFTNVTGLHPGDRADVGQLRITAVPSVDGFGTPQVAYVVEGGDTKAIHCGDTMFHGHWWNIARSCGPIDVAFLPVNGAVVEISFFTPPSRFEACLTPEQAVEAAYLLRAKQLVPIHYDGFNNPPKYTQASDLPARLQQAAAGHGVELNKIQTYQSLV